MGMTELEKVISVLSAYNNHSFGDKDEKVTVEEIIALLKKQEPPTNASISSAIECLLHPQDADDSDMAKAIDTAVRAMRLLKAQEPVKPTEPDEDNTRYCGACGSPVGYEVLEAPELDYIQYNYCPVCGRKVKWE